MKRRDFLALIPVAAASLTSGCGSGTGSIEPAIALNSTTPLRATYTLNLIDQIDGVPKVTLVGPNGETGTDEDLKEILQSMPMETGQIGFAINHPMEADPSRFISGDYEVYVSAHRGNLSSCIDRKNVFHLGFLIKNIPQKWVLFDIHLAIWWENGPQIGLYITRGEDWNTYALFCKTTRGTFTAIRDAISDALRSQGIGPSPAYWLALAIAVVALPLLGLA